MQNKYINSELNIQHNNSISSQVVIFATNIDFHYMKDMFVDGNGALQLKHKGKDSPCLPENQFTKLLPFKTVIFVPRGRSKNKYLHEIYMTTYDWILHRQCILLLLIKSLSMSIRFLLSPIKFFLILLKLKTSSFQDDF